MDGRYPHMTKPKNSPKEFSQQLHTDYDQLGRDIVATWFLYNKSGSYAKNNPDIYGVDLMLYEEISDRLIGYAEVEIRQNWDGDTINFPTLHVPYRKKKLLDNIMPTVFFAINKQLTHMYCCAAKTILNAPVIEVPNKYKNKGELFYNIPVEQLAHYETGWHQTPHGHQNKPNNTANTLDTNTPHIVH